MLCLWVYYNNDTNKIKSSRYKIYSIIYGCVYNNNNLNNVIFEPYPFYKQRLF